MEKKGLVFAHKKPPTLSEESWKVLVVDDEPEVHVITKTVLSKFVFENRPIQTISAYSAKEAMELIQNNPEVALILLDVVMEEDNSGLLFAKHVRDELKNKNVRIVLRTGQPGQAPEKEIIVSYDINDYKEKTELTSEKLFTTVIASLRNFRDLIYIDKKRSKIDNNRKALKRVMNCCSKVFEIKNFADFSKNVVLSCNHILTNREFGDEGGIDAFIAEGVCLESNIVYAIGSLNKYINTKFEDIKDQKVVDFVKDTLDKKTSISKENMYTGYFPSIDGCVNILFLRKDDDFTKDEIDLLNIFSYNAQIAFENLYLDRDIKDTQAEVIHTLGEVVESRSKETANHVKRVAHYAYILAKKFGLSDEDAKILKHASPLHDVGKIGIQDSILLKTSKLTQEEFEIIKTHSQIGYDILKKSKRSLLKAAAIIANEHHEKYDGTGYPNKKAAEDIHIFGRIVAIADVFDALTHKRCYKQPWSVEESIEYIISQKGKHFDPMLVDLFFDDIDALKKIMKKFAD